MLNPTNFAEACQNLEAIQKALYEKYPDALNQFDYDLKGVLFFLAAHRSKEEAEKKVAYDHAVRKLTPDELSVLKEYGLPK